MTFQSFPKPTKKIKVHKPIRKIGKIGKRNAQSNRILKSIYEEKGITKCEVGFIGCSGGSFLSFAHKHKRHFYLSQPKLLSSFNETLLACINCHSKLEVDKDLTVSTFDRLRGPESGMSNALDKRYIMIYS